MLEIALQFGVVVYAIGFAVFLVNCSTQAVNKGQHIGTRVFTTALFWPAFLLAAIVGRPAHGLPAQLRRLAIRSHE